MTNGVKSARCKEPGVLFVRFCSCRSWATRARVGMWALGMALLLQVSVMSLPPFCFRFWLDIRSDNNDYYFAHRARLRNFGAGSLFHLSHPSKRVQRACILCSAVGTTHPVPFVCLRCRTSVLANKTKRNETTQNEHTCRFIHPPGTKVRRPRRAF